MRAGGEGLFALAPDEAGRIADREGTPCFVYRLDVAVERFRRLAGVLPPRVRLAYAVKANPHPLLLSRFAGLGASFDCASEGELGRVKAVGASGERILFAGPGKSESAMGAALELGARIEVDGIEDLERIQARLESAGARPRPLAVSLRVHPGRGIAEASRIIGGAGPSAFGVDEEELGAFLGEAGRYDLLRITGLQVFAASNERDAARLLENHRVALDIAGRMAADFGLELDLVDLGGGLGIPYAPDEAELDIEALGVGLAGLLGENPWFRGNLLLEPGRWLAGPAGVYLTRVLRVKRSRGVNFAVLEGGINHLLRPLLTGQPFPVACVGKEGRPLPWTLAGPLCSSLDRLGEVELPALEAGDLLVFGQAGAYGFTEAMGAFLSHPPAREHCLEAEGGCIVSP